MADPDDNAMDTGVLRDRIAELRDELRERDALVQEQQELLHDRAALLRDKDRQIARLSGEPVEPAVAPPPPPSMAPRPLTVDAQLERVRARLAAHGVDETSQAVDGTLRPTVETDALAATGRSDPSLRIGELPLVRYTGSGDADTGELVRVRLLGEGGMGRVDLATQRDLQRQVAVKQVRDTRRSRPALEALLHEARITGGLEHPNIVPVHRLARTGDDLPLMVMKRIEGVSWRDLIRDPDHELWARDPRDPLERHLEVFVQVCHAVEFAHRRGVLHRDLKPDNVMLGHFGEVYLLDWGVAVHFGAGASPTPAPLMGTPAYMAPEMALGEDLDARSDVYLLGACLHEVLLGHPRHRGRTLIETRRVREQRGDRRRSRGCPPATGSRRDPESTSWR